tara:strand:+ start:493 stop:1410 length:918 start_codon:yes stop_codon:yes gene_type:complete
MPINPFPHIKEAEKRFNWHRHILRDRVKAQLTYAAGRQPVVVYSMPKTASAAVYKALRKARGVFVLKSHTLRPEHWRKRRLDPAWTQGGTGMWRDHWHSDRMVHDRIIGRGKPCKFIALVREPVATNISAFLYFPSNWLSPKAMAAGGLAAMTPESVEAAFFDRYPHHVTTDWFDLEPAATLGIDVYQTPFPWDAGHATYTNGPFQLLVLRTELDDAVKSQVVNEFLGTKSVRIERTNTADQHGLRPRVDNLKARMADNPEYVNALLDHRFTAHFWSPKEREALRRKWLTPRPAPAAEPAQTARR